MDLTALLILVVPCVTASLWVNYERLRAGLQPIEDLKLETFLIAIEEKKELG